MEKFDPNEYRNNLAKVLRDIHKEDPETAQQVLGGIQKTPNYKEAEKEHQKEQQDQRNKDQITQEKYIELARRLNKDNMYEIVGIKDSTGIVPSEEVIQTCYASLLNGYPAGRTIRNFQKAIGKVEPSFTPEQKLDALSNRIFQQQSVFSDIIEYLGPNLEREVANKCYEKLANKLYEELEKEDWSHLLVTIQDICEIYENTTIIAKLDEEKVKKIYYELLNEPVKNEYKKPGQYLWKIDALHKATGIQYPQWNQNEIQKLYDDLIEFDGYSDQNDRLLKFKEITGASKKSW